MPTVIKTVTDREERHASIAFFLWFLGIVGACGLQRLYLGHYRLGIAMLATLGFCGIGQLIDVVFLLQATRKVNESNGYLETKKKYKMKMSSNNDTEGNETEAVAKRISDFDHYEEWNKEHVSIAETIKKLKN